MTTVIILDTAIDGISRQTLARFATRARELAGVSGEVAVLITSSRQIQQLNRRFRRKNKPTDVLSFPREGGGDIAISAEIAQSNAQRFRHSTAAEIKVLILHGMLHLAGYDHESDNGGMQKREAMLRAATQAAGISHSAKFEWTGQLSGFRQKGFSRQKGFGCQNGVESTCRKS